jgi:hypothetical protein
MHGSDLSTFFLEKSSAARAHAALLTLMWQSVQISRKPQDWRELNHPSGKLVVSYGRMPGLQGARTLGTVEQGGLRE